MSSVNPELVKALGPQLAGVVDALVARIVALEARFETATKLVELQYEGEITAGMLADALEQNVAPGVYNAMVKRYNDRIQEVNKRLEKGA